MKLHVPFLLGCIVLMGVLLCAIPLFLYPVWGSDTGEYYFLSSHITSTGSMLRDGYEGWGEVYPYFPGFLLMASTISLLTGLGVLGSLMIIPLVVVSLSIISIFLIGRRIFRSDPGALLAAGFLAVVMPHVYPVSHPMPGSLGDALLVFGLLLILASVEDRRFWCVIAPLSVTLIVTHHLSSYLFLLAIIGGMLLQELFIAKELRDRSRIMRECAFITFFYAVMVSFWLFLAPGFERRVLSTAIPFVSPEVLALLGLFLIAILPFLALWSPKIPSLGRSVPGERELAIRIIVIVIIIAFILGISASVGIPATSAKIPLISILFFLPLIAIIIPVIIGSRAFDLYEEGNTAFGWFTAIALSGLLGVATGSIALSPYRHVQYLMIPFALFFAAGLLLFHSFSGERKRRTVAISATCAALILINIPLAYPSQEIMIGFEEGVYPQELGALTWSGQSTPSHSVFASDHRMSSMLFGIEGKYATWDTTPKTFSQGNFSADVKVELSSARAPFAPRQVQYMLLSEVMKRGVALDPNMQAVPLSEESMRKFGLDPFVTLYDNGFAQVLMIDWSRA